MKPMSVLHKCVSLAAFMVPGLALWLPSGYSYGAVLLLSAALLGLPWWWRDCRVSVHSGLLVLSIGVMGAIWVLDSSSDQWDWGQFDRPAKYVLALLCLFLLLAVAPNPRYLWSGIAVGAVGSGGVALYQVLGLGMPRAEGYTNAIQYGNLSVLLALMCLLLLAVRPPALRAWQSLLLACGVVLGLLGSVLSQSRGGWLALLLILPLLVWVLRSFLPWRQLIVGALALFCVILALGLLLRSELELRFNQARTEISRYEQQGDANSSVGQRLAHWKLAWNMGLERPLLGWGRDGYAVEKKRRVEAGQAHPFVLMFGHVHNEILDLFVKHGLLGVAGLGLFYGTPLLIFWPRRRLLMRPLVNAPAGGPLYLDRTALALRLVGWIIPVAYIGFGFSQVFFAHNSGNLFYLFMIMLSYSALLAHERSNPR